MNKDKITKIVFVVAISMSKVQRALQGEDESLDGTSSATIALVNKFRAMPRYQVTILFGESSSLRLVNDRGSLAREDGCSGLGEGSVVICPAVHQVFLKPFRLAFCRIFLWIHHPFWRRFIDDQLIERYVYCGDYVSKLRPLSLPANKISAIQNLRPETKPRRSDLERKKGHTLKYDVIYMGAMIRTKGVLVLLNDLNAIKPNKPLRVALIGSWTLYGPDMVSDGEDQVFAADIRQEAMRLISELRQKGACIEILGNLGDRRFELIASSRVLVVNPTGNSEAFSTSIIEGYRIGVPTISGYRNGNKDLVVGCGRYSRAELRNWLTKYGVKKIHNQVSLQNQVLKRLLRPQEIVDRWVSLIDQDGEYPEIRLFDTRHGIGDYLRMLRARQLIEGFS